MKSPFLILFIILNLLAVNLVSAMNIDDGDTGESHLVHSQDDPAQEAVQATCIDESSCDHFCHISAHMMGFFSQVAQIHTINTAINLPILKEQFHSLILDPPFLPPQS